MINIAAAETENNLKPKLSVLGVGGAGCNAVNNMVDSGLEGVDFIVANTDAQSLSSSKAQRKIQLGMEITKGLGAGADPSVGRASAEETLEEVVEALSDSNMVFVTAGMGGGTGSGASPVICNALREKGILTVGVVTKPFNFEGRQRQKVADAALENMKNSVDTLIIIPNQNLFNIIDKNTTLTDAFNMADEVLHAGVSSITDLIVKQGRMNKDFADIKEIVGKMGEAMMGTGEAEGENRAIEAAEKAIANPLLDNVSMKGAKGVLLNITGSKDITLFEVDAVTNRIRAEIDSEDEAEFIIGTTLDDAMGDVLKVSIVATGMSDASHVRNVVCSAKKPAVARPFMDDDLEDITEIAEDVTPVDNMDDKVVEDLDDSDILMPGLFTPLDEDEADISTNTEDKVFEDFEKAEDIPVVAEAKEENIVKISEHGEVIRPQDVKATVVEEPMVAARPEEMKTEKESFMKRIMKSKDKKEVESDDNVIEKKEKYEDMVLPDFLSR
ncbi:MAG: cell division protein FtsZ [Alphaproteobacteria bacterium]|nr:cell division protein FtsZ [Alphaproteobacteria bacterium]